MKGKDLQIAVRNSGIPIAEVSRLSEIPESTIFKLYKKDIVEDHYLIKIEKSGVELPKTAGLSRETFDKAIDALYQAVDTTAKMLEMIKSDADFHRNILEDGFKKGAIHYSAPKKQPA